MTDEVRTTYGGVPKNADVVALADGGSATIGKVGIDQSTPGTSNGVMVTNPTPLIVGDRFVVVTSTVPIAGVSYLSNQVVGGLGTMALGIGNNTPFVINSVAVTVLSSSAALPSTSFGGILTFFGTAAPNGTYTDQQVQVVSTADQANIIRSALASVSYATGSTFGAVFAGSYKSGGAGKTTPTGNIAFALMSTSTLAFTGAGILSVTLTINY